MVTLERRRQLRRTRLADIAREMVGVGGVGTRAWIVLLIGRDENDTLVLRVREAEPSLRDGSPGRI